jgi:hypothetical protein
VHGRVLKKVFYLRMINSYTGDVVVCLLPGETKSDFAPFFNLFLGKSSRAAERKISQSHKLLRNDNLGFLK